MAFEERAALPEDVQNFVAVVARWTSESPGVSFSVEITSVSCARSRTSMAKMNLWKSGEPARIDRLWMLASQAAMADDTWASVPGLLSAIIEMTILWLRSSRPVTSQRTSIQATSESCSETRASEWIG